MKKYRKTVIQKKWLKKTAAHYLASKFGQFEVMAPLTTIQPEAGEQKRTSEVGICR